MSNQGGRYKNVNRGKIRKINSGGRNAGSRARHNRISRKRDKNRFSTTMQKKLLVLYVMVLFAFVGLSVRMYWIVKEDSTDYQKQVLSQQRYDSTTIPYRRGDIVDAKGTRLATSEKVYNLVIDAKVMTTEIKKEGSMQAVYLEPTLQALADNFDLDMAAIREYVATHKSSSYYVPLKQLSYEEISGFQMAQLENSNIRGVWFEEEYKRLYPYGALAADVIGFTGADNTGHYGLEEYYNDVLNGINGREYGYLNEDLMLERTVKSAVDGYNIHSTIDANIQMTVEKNINQFMEEFKDAYTPGNGAENAGCVIMDINSGEVLAMASAPGFDLNDSRNPQSLIGSRMVELVENAAGYQELHKTRTIIDDAVLSDMNSDQLYLNLNYLWKNYCISDTYEPGSTAKPFTVGAALEEGVISANDSFVCDGYLEIGGHRIRCHNRWDGTLSLEEAVAKSCNVTMMKIAQMLGAEDFCKFQEVFNFGLKTNIDLAGEARTASLIYTADKMGPTDLATNSFGQNFNVTMIEMITGFCSLINGGKYYEPHMVSKITNTNGATVQNIEPRVLKQTISETTSETIRQACVAVVDYGTGTTARPAGYRIGGKTGTAETIDPETHKRSENEHVVSFIGFAPADDPQIAIYVVIDRPNAANQADAKYATRLVRSILTEVLPYLNIFMTEEPTDAEKAELAALHMEITNQYTRPAEGDEPEEEPVPTPPAVVQPWTNFPIDPDTGYYKDPDTGELYDPRTGLAVNGGETVVDPDIPVNPNLPANPDIQ